MPDDLNPDDLNNEYSKKGFVILKNLISPSDVQNYIKIANKHQLNHSKVDYIYDYIRFFDFRLYSKYLKYFNLKYLYDCFYLISKSKNQEWRKKIPSLDFNNQKKLSTIDSYISKKSNDDILEWHTDQAFGGATHPAEFFNNQNGKISLKNINKLFVHVTDVKYGNGAFSYIPYSHKINLAIRTLINKQVIKYKPFLLLQDAIELIDGQYKDKFLQVLTIEQIELFIKSAKKALLNDQEFVIECNAGDAILFNDFGYHKGTAPKISDRVIFRYWY